jgi:hypothetical protein
MEQPQEVTSGYQLAAFLPTLGTGHQNEGFRSWFVFDGDGNGDEEDDLVKFQRSLAAKP